MRLKSVRLLIQAKRTGYFGLWYWYWYFYCCKQIKGIRAALCHETYTAKMSREHNNANVLAMGGRTTGFEIADESCVHG